MAEMLPLKRTPRLFCGQQWRGRRRRSCLPGACLDQLLDRWDNHNQQLGLRFLGLLSHDKLLGDPSRWRRFTAVEIVEGSQARGTKSREVLRDRRNFLEQKRFFKHGLKLNLIVSPAAEQGSDAGFRAWP